MIRRTLIGLVDTLLSAVDGKVKINDQILLAQALQEIDRRLSALEARPDLARVIEDASRSVDDFLTKRVTEEQGRAIWDGLYGPNGTRDSETGAERVDLRTDLPTLAARLNGVFEAAFKAHAGTHGERLDAGWRAVAGVVRTDPTQPIPWPSRAIVEALYQLKIKLTTTEQREAMRALEKVVYQRAEDSEP